MEHPLFAAAQRFVLAGGVTPDSGRFAKLELEPAAPFSPAEAGAFTAAFGTPSSTSATSLAELLEEVKL